jgi:hypothetical protein
MIRVRCPVKSTDIQACANLPRKILATSGFAKAWEARFSVVREMVYLVPPSPLSPESLAGRGVHKKCLQNLDGREVTGQNLENKGLTLDLRLAEYTVSASTIMG